MNLSGSLLIPIDGSDHPDISDDKEGYEDQVMNEMYNVEYEDEHRPRYGATDQRGKFE